MKRLTEEVRARPAEMHPLLFAAALRHWSYAAQRLHVTSRTIAIPLCTKSRDQARDQDGTSTGKGSE